MSRSIFDVLRMAEDEDHGGPLLFSQRVLGPVPLRGSETPPPLREEEIDELDTQVVGKVKTFHLADPEQLAEYELVLHRIVNNWYVRLHQEYHFDPETKSMIVHLEWCQRYHEIPPRLEQSLREEVRRAH